MKILATIEITENARTIVAFQKKYPKATILEVNGKEVDGLCEACGKILFSDFIYHTDSEGCLLCPHCWSEDG